MASERLELVSLKELKQKNGIHAESLVLPQLKSTDVIFMQPVSRLDTHRYSRGILLLSAYLEQHGIPNIIFESHRLLSKPMVWHFPSPEQVQEVESKLLEKVVQWKTKIICFTCSTVEFNETIEFAKKIRKVVPNAVFVAGGYHADAFPEDFLNNGFDYAVRGEGELTILELFQALFGGRKDFPAIDGLAWKKPTGEVVVNKRRALLAEFDELPLPAYHKIDMPHYLKIWDGTLRGIPCRGALLETSRGCPWSCNFCSCPTIAGHRMRYRSEESLDTEVKLLKEKYGVEGFMLTDDMFTVSMDHIKKVSRVMKKHGIVWTAQARTHAVTEEMLRVMKDAGCVQIDFGVESGSQRVLDEIINKKATTDHARQAFALCKKVGIRAMANLMLGNPTETEEEMKLTLALAKEIKPDYVFYSIVAPLPNTKLYEMVNAMLPEDNKITVEDYKSIDWTGKNYSEKLNFSKVKDLSRIHKIFERELHGLVLRNAVKNNIFYFKMMLMLPHRIEKLRYLGKKLCNFFVVKRIFGKDLRL
ncbi:TPA: B12-binding domain-containing radical SAM protein [Candidatus Woesearchaeota archaeon]|nr:B12-binding domain-containing radical SAM protein [Candidatus Woesearchaeota archaeon]